MVVKMARSVIGGLTFAVLVSAGAAYGDPVTVPYNQQKDVNGVTVACTGVGQSRQNADWNNFPVRVEFAQPSGHLLADVAVVLRHAGGDTVAEVACKGPWVLFKVPPGNYRVEGRLPGSNAKPQNATVVAPATGQARVALLFPDA